MKIALLISTYNWPQALDKVLQSVMQQSILPYEVLIADDGSTNDTKWLIEKWQNKDQLKIKHFWQEDQGFRKTIIMNKAISSTDAKYIIQIDGDIILDKNFIKDHLSAQEKGFFINGARALISPENTINILSSPDLNMTQVSRKIKNKINATRIPFLSPFLRKDHLKSNNVKGCNFSFYKEDFVAVNGYNNDISGWGHEDIELAARLNNLGIKQRRLKLSAVCYHLYHDYFDRKNEATNFSNYEAVVKNKTIRCENGYEQSL